jgi:hypothetical protein
MCDPLLDIPVSSSVERTDGHLDTAMKNKGVTMDQIDPEVSVDEKAELAQGAAAIAATEAEFDPSVAIPGEPMDEYQAIITAKDAWLACEDLADICRERDKEIVRLKSELDQAMRVVRLVDSIFILVGKLNVSTVSVIGAAS